MPPRFTIAAITLTASLLAGCTPAAAPPPSPTASPTYICTPEAGGPAQPCGPIEYEQAQKRDAEYSEAETVFLRYWTEFDRLTAEPTPAFTQVLDETTSGDFKVRLVAALEPAAHAQRVSGAATTSSLQRVPGLSRAGATVALHVCIDARGAAYVTQESPQPEPGIAYEQRLYFARVGSKLKLVESESREVPQC